MPQNVFHDVSLTAFDETDDFHPGPTLRALQRIDFKHPFDQSGPTRSRPARFGLGGRSCLIDKPPVNLHFVARRLLGADPSAPIRIPSEISDQMFSLVRDVLREFREEIERVENLKVAAAEKSDKPFFVYYPMILVHSPFIPTPDSAERKNKNKQQNFEDMVAYMDKLVGRLIKKTEQLGIADNTLFLFVGDNGTGRSLRSQLGGTTIRGGKGAMTDAGTRVAMIGYWPGTIPPGRESNDLIDFSDFVPTLLEAAGDDAPAKFDGRSFLPQLQGESGNPRDWIYMYYCPRPEKSKQVRFVRNQRWKLYGDGRFYNVAADPLEKNIALTSAGSEGAKTHEQFTAALKSMPAEGQSLLKFGNPLP